MEFNYPLNKAAGKVLNSFPDTALVIVGTKALPAHAPEGNVRPFMDTVMVTLMKSDVTGSTAEHH